VSLDQEHEIILYYRLTGRTAEKFRHQAKENRLGKYQGSLVARPGWGEPLQY
jgi:hypothetical protein